MDSSEYWSSEAQSERLLPLLPDNVRGVARVDDRQVISGINHVVKSNGRWVDAPTCYGLSRTPSAEILIDSIHMKAHRLAGGGKREALVQAIWISRVGRNSKLHELTDREGRSRRFLLSGGKVADCRATDVLLDDLAPRTMVLADKAYDINAIRDPIEHQGAVPNIASKTNRRWKSCFSRTLCRGRNAVDRMFFHLKDYWRIATRYDKLAINFLSAIYLAATATWWL